MERDFSYSAQQRLLELVRQVEDEKWSDFTDWIGDRFLGLRALVGELAIGNYLDRVDEYHKLVIDKNNATEAGINTIFQRVYSVDGAYVARFSACQVRLERYCSLLEQVASVIDPSKACGGDFDPGSLERAFSSYDAAEAALAKISASDEGVSYDDLDSMSQEMRQAMLQHLASTAVDYLPALDVGEEFELPIGPDVSLYYTVSGNVDGVSEVTVKTAIDEGRAELKGLSFSGESAGGEVKISGAVSNEGGVSASVSSDHGSWKFSHEGTEYSTSWKNGNKTYSYTDGFEFSSAKIYAEESVTIDVDGGFVTSGFGIKAGSGGGWQPLPEPVPVPASDPVTLPQWEAPEVDWHAVEVGVAVGVIVIAGVALTAFTFGGSDVAAGAAAAALVVAL